MPKQLVVVGLGYVGLPLAQAASKAGLAVTGLDLNEAVVSGLNSGRSHVDDLSTADIETMLAQGFKASSDESVISGADVVVVCVPTPLSEDGGPDLGAVIGATKAIARNLKAGQLVVLESTTYPGTTDDIVKPLLEESGLKAGVDFELAFSPERIDPGNPVYGMTNTPKVVGGFTPEGTKVAVDFYSMFVDSVIAAKGTREAEMAKLLENTYRHVNIALMNELVEFCHLLDIDLWDSIRCASTKPFGYQAFYPGPGVGGHCIPIDPNYLSHHVKSVLGRPFRFVELAQEINEGMPSYVGARIQDSLNNQSKALKDSKVLLLGVTYKADIADQRESPVRPLARELLSKGAIVQFADPYVSTWNVDSEHGDHDGDTILNRVSDTDAAVKDADIVVLLQNHKDFDLTKIAANAKFILDTRGVLSGDNVSRL
jgi:UDP-N-acetyl-D-glucosamine dehydrogenase